MHSSMIGKIEKAHRYAQEPDRVRFDALMVTFRGGHDEYRVELRDGRWHCSCHTFESHVVGTCSHVMALQEMLSASLAADSRYSLEPLTEALPV